MPSSFKPVDLKHASRLINHGPSVLVTTTNGRGRNIMAAAWSMPVEFTPPRIAIVIDKKTFTRELIEATGAFAVVIPGRDLVDLTYAVGSETGREVDKFARYNIVANAGPALGMPVIEEGCSAWMECRRIAEPHTEDAYDTCFAEVVSAAADECIFKGGRWVLTPDNAALHTIHHLGAGSFACAGELLTASGRHR